LFEEDDDILNTKERRERAEAAPPPARHFSHAQGGAEPPRGGGGRPPVRGRRVHPHHGVTALRRELLDHRLDITGRDFYRWNSDIFVSEYQDKK